ncbi:uncharacterized protein LOC132940652 [Metopolophium dirhodum]|uniref:uncharacterized protein LOC132940652 n=1 Tax=Metopolophium dirhodum TaxID=44670 RepID=UPI0029907B77|nr:uncharacterized protein LOC132940652 [Metopolophium dirhodum]
MSRPPAHPKGWAPTPSVTSPPVSFRPATPTRHSPIHRLPPPYIPCPKPMRPTSSPLPAAVPQPYRYPSPCPSPQVYESPTSMPSYRPREFVVLEAPSPQQWSDEENTMTDGRSTAEIIAQQSQDYVDEKLAEYQATIYMLQEEEEEFVYVCLTSITVHQTILHFFIGWCWCETYVNIWYHKIEKVCYTN